MRSYDSPGRIITVTNSGPGAVPVRGDQPYRLRSLIGVTMAPAKVGEDLNLCVEGVYGQVVELADPAVPALEGDPVGMSTDGSWRLVAGLAEGTDGFVMFGVLAQPVRRAKEVALVKVMASALPAAPASGGGEGGGTDPALVARVGEAEDAILVLDERVDGHDQAIAALQAGGGGGDAGPDYLAGPCIMQCDNTRYSPAGGTVMVVFNSPQKAQGRDCHGFGAGNSSYLVAEKSGWFSFDLDILVGSATGGPCRIGVQAISYSSDGQVIGFALPSGQGTDVLGFAAFEQRGNGHIYATSRVLMYLPAGYKVAITLYRCKTDTNVGGFDPGGIQVQRFTVAMRREA